MISPSPAPAIDWGALVVQPAISGTPARGVRRFAGQTIVCELQDLAERTVRDHAATAPRLEVGGLLIGDVYTAGSGFHVDVSGALPARRAISGMLHLRFGVAAWLDLTRERHLRKRERVVGWYHTHPGIGVFLSATDRNLHGAFFCGLPWYVALVFDPAGPAGPAGDELGVFAQDDGALGQLAAVARADGPLAGQAGQERST